MKINPTFSRWFPVVLWAAVIFIASANPDPFHLLPQGWITFCQSAGMDLPDCNELLGRFSHTAEYAVLAALLARALVWQGKPQIFLWVIVLEFLSSMPSLMRSTSCLSREDNSNCRTWDLTFLEVPSVWQSLQ